MDYKKNHWNLKSAFKPVPEAFERTVRNTVQSIRAEAPSVPPSGRARGGRSRKIAALVLAALLLLGVAAAYAIARPALLDWLLGMDRAGQPYPAGASLRSAVQPIRGENTADHITVRMDSLVYDGERFSFSYEIENDAPAFPALVAPDPCITVNGAPVFLEEFMADGAAPCMVPSPHLDVLPVQRNPLLRGGWSRIISQALSGEIECEMTFMVYRPKKTFAVVPDPDDMVFRLTDCAPEQQAEVQDVIDTYGSFQNAVLAGRNALDPEKWFRNGYSVIGGFIDPREWIDPNEEGFDHLKETARITVAFRFDADIRQAFDFSDTADVALEDCFLHVHRFRLSPLTTYVYVDLIPRENTKEAAQALVEKYGPMDLTDGQGNAVEYAQMDSIYENMPWATQHDGQWLCRYMIGMPGLQAWPDSVGLTVHTGDLLRVWLGR